MSRLTRLLGDCFRRSRVSQFQLPLNQWSNIQNPSLRQISSVSKIQMKSKNGNAIQDWKPDVASGVKLLVSSARFSPLSARPLSSGHPECECEDLEDEGPHKDETKIWKVLTLYVCLPVILVGSYLVWRHESQPHKRPEFIPYDHLRIRTRPFPWGDGNHTLMHNKCLNALPEGYEEEEDECHKENHSK